MEESKFTCEYVDQIVYWPNVKVNEVLHRVSLVFYIRTICMTAFTSLCIWKIPPPPHITFTLFLNRLDFLHCICVVIVPYENTKPRVLRQWPSRCLRMGILRVGWYDGTCFFCEMKWKIAPIILEFIIMCQGFGSYTSCLCEASTISQDIFFINQKSRPPRLTADFQVFLFKTYTGKIVNFLSVICGIDRRWIFVIFRGRWYLGLKVKVIAEIDNSNLYRDKRFLASFLIHAS